MFYMNEITPIEDSVTETPEQDGVVDPQILKEKEIQLTWELQEIYDFLEKKFRAAGIIQSVGQRLALIVRLESRLNTFLSADGNESLYEEDLIELYNALGRPEPRLEMPKLPSTDDIIMGTHADWSGEWAWWTAGREE